jgi:nicotinate-nucleotide adenylyltransferase
VARGTPTRHNLGATYVQKIKSLDHSLILYGVFRKTRWYKKADREHSRATCLATAPANEETNGASRGVNGEYNGMNIGLFGGSFDPIHRGHLALAQAAASRYSLQQVLFVPANVPPHKQKQPLTAFIHRYAMVTLATQDERGFVASLLEAPEWTASEQTTVELRPTRQPKAVVPAIDRANYSIDTVRRLKKNLKKSDRLFFLIGIDAFRDIAKWHEARAILAECDFIVASRPGYSLRDVAESLPEGLRPPAAVTRPFHKQPAKGDLVLPGVTLHLLEGVHQSVSATGIRTAAAQGKPLARWLDPRVADYVRKQGLYRAAKRVTGEAS